MMPFKTRNVLILNAKHNDLGPGICFYVLRDLVPRYLDFPQTRAYLTSNRILRIKGRVGDPMQSLLDLPGGSPVAGRRRIPDAGFRRLHGLSPDFESQHFTHQASVPSHRKHRQLFLTSQSHLRGLKGKKKKKKWTQSLSIFTAPKEQWLGLFLL